MSTPSEGFPAQELPAGDPPLVAARQVLAHFLSLALRDPRGPAYDRLMEPGALETAEAAARLVREALPAERSDPGRGEEPVEALAPEALAAFLADREEVVRAHQAVFGLLLSSDCPPYRTEYCRQRSPVLRSHVMADIAGFYQAFGLQPAEHEPERFDHVALQLEFLAWLGAKDAYALSRADLAEERASICRDARQRFFREHVLPWVPSFARVLRLRVARAVGDQGRYYDALAILLASWVGVERRLYGLPPAVDELEAPGSDLDHGAVCPTAGEDCSPVPV